MYVNMRLFFLIGLGCTLAFYTRMSTPDTWLLPVLVLGIASGEVLRDAKVMSSRQLVAYDVTLVVGLIIVWVAQGNF